LPGSMGGVLLFTVREKEAVPGSPLPYPGPALPMSGRRTYGNG